MAKRHYKTLKGLLSQTLYGEINFIDFHWGKFYHKKLGWVHFTLPIEVRVNAYKMFANVVWSRKADEKAYLLNRYKGNAHGILKGLTINLSRWRGEYGAGQDYPSEIKVIQGIFRNGN